MFHKFCAGRPTHAFAFFQGLRAGPSHFLNPTFCRPTPQIALSHDCGTRSHGVRSGKLQKATFFRVETHGRASLPIKYTPCGARGLNSKPFTTAILRPHAAFCGVRQRIGLNARSHDGLAIIWLACALCIPFNLAHRQQSSPFSMKKCVSNPCNPKNLCSTAKAPLKSLILNPTGTTPLKKNE